MTGNNELRLNLATMIEIVQEWLDSRTKDLRKQYVRSISERSIENCFVIKIESEGE